MTSIPGTSRRARTWSRLSASTSILQAGVFLVHALDRGAELAEPVAGEEMIVLHQDHVEEAEAVVRSAARRDRRFLKFPQTGRGLARVEDLRAIGPGRLDELPGQGRDSAQALEKIERDPLGGEDGPGAAAYFHDRHRLRRQWRHLSGQFRPASSGSTRRKTSAATSVPATIARSLAMARAEAFSFSPTKYWLVMSPVPISSRRARSISWRSSAVKAMPEHNAGRMTVNKACRYKKDPGRAREEKPSNARACHRPNRLNQ